MGRTPPPPGRGGPLPAMRPAHLRWRTGVLPEVPLVLDLEPHEVVVPLGRGAHSTGGATPPLITALGPNCEQVSARISATLGIPQNYGPKKLHNPEINPFLKKIQPSPQVGSR